MSLVATSGVYEEENTGCNLPAQVEVECGLAVRDEGQEIQGLSALPDFDDPRCDGGDDRLLERRGRQPPTRRVFHAGDQPVGDIVAQTGAFLRSRMGWRQPVPGLIEDLPAEQRHATGRFPQAYPGSHPLQPELNSIPPVGGNDRVVLAVMYLVAVPDAPGIDRVRQDVMNMPAVEGATAARLAGRQQPAPRTQPQRIGLLFQDADDQLFSPTVLEDVAFGPLNLGKSKDEAVDIARRTLNFLGLAGFEERITFKLSGGEKRLVSLATVLAMEPEILLLDEPINGLDIKTKAKLTETLTGLDLSYILVSHDFDFLAETVDAIYTMADGKILLDKELHVHEHVHAHELGTYPHKHEMSKNKRGLSAED